MTAELLAGFGRRDITPKAPCFLVGYPHVERLSTGVHDPLFASTVCLQNQGTTLIVISLDLAFVSLQWVRECRSRIVSHTGPAEILIGATHTHSGPHTVEVLAWKDDPVVPPVDPEYLAYLMDETVVSALQAWEARQPAEAGWTTANVRGLAGGNRIDPNGVENPEAGLLLIRSAAENAPLAVISIYGMHPTVLHEDSTLFSGDFIAIARQTIEEALPGAGVVYLNGACGNQSPRRVVRGQTFEEAIRIGSDLGRTLSKALRDIDKFDANLPLQGMTSEIHLEGKKFPPIAEAEENLSRARGRYARLQQEKAPAPIVRTAECTLFGAEEVVTLAKAEINGEAEVLRQNYRTQEVQVLKIGETFLVGWPGEFFVEYALQLKRLSEHRVFLSTITNGELQGYIVTPKAEALGGYEAQMSLFPASSGACFVQATLDIMRSF